MKKIEKKGFIILVLRRRFRS